jgi:hypothetical protein
VELSARLLTRQQRLSKKPDDKTGYHEEKFVQRVNASGLRAVNSTDTRCCLS